MTFADRRTWFAPSLETRRAATLVFLLILNAKFFVIGAEQHGPHFVREPPNQVQFSNETGMDVDCTARGSPAAKMTWIRTDGNAIADVADLLRVLANGTVRFLPFRAESYRQDVHAADFKCVASNAVGTVISRDVKIRGVVRQMYKVQVYDEFVIKGNTGVLKCHVPSFVKDHVTVVAWVTDDDTSIVMTSARSSGRYYISSSGDLYVSGVGKDSTKSYRCKTINQLTGETQMSEAGRLIITDPQSSVSPKISHSTPIVNARAGTTVELPCAAQGMPVPAHNWFQQKEFEAITIARSERVKELNSVLVLENVTSDDSGTYICVVKNNVGEDRGETVLTVTVSLTATLQPEHQIVDVGRTALFNCVVSGHPVTVTWRKNGQPLDSDERVQFLSREVLRISDVKNSDSGMYQCFVTDEDRSAQGAAELILGDTGPEIVAAFPETTVEQGQSVSLECRASGNPAPRVSWKLDGQEVPFMHRMNVRSYIMAQGDVLSRINVTETRVEDGGIYSCEAVNKISHAVYSARVNVWGPPYIRPMANVTVVAGEDLVMKCPVAGYPIESIMWERDSRVLPVTLRQVAFPNGTLLIRKLERSDGGSYTCVANNKHHQSDRKSLSISVVVPPRIEPFAFPKEVREGMRTRLLCSADGDPPVRISWLKDGQPLVAVAGLGVTVQSTDEFSNLLTFKSLSEYHNGNYSCVANNVAATVTHTARLEVQVPPYWTSEPKDDKVMLGKEALLSCGAGGHPTPAISWMRGRGKLPGNYSNVLSGSNFDQKVHSNGSLVFERVRKSDEGYYLCQASNGIGSGLSKVVLLTINVPAHFMIKEANISSREGDDAILACEAFGDKPMEIRWVWNGARVDPKRDKRFQISKMDTEFGVVSELTFHRATTTDSATAKCYATNGFGHDETSLHFVTQARPHRPEGVAVVAVTGRTGKLEWKRPFAGNTPITSYILEYFRAAAASQEDSSDGRGRNITVLGEEVTATARGLLPGTSYTVRVYAVNSVGTSDSSDSIDLTTSEEAPGGPPLAVEAKATGPDAVVVSWKHPRADLWNGLLLGYYVGSKIYDSSDPYKHNTVDLTVGSERMEYHISDLKKFTKYSIVVKAFNRMGGGPNSDEVIVVTAEDAPDMPPEDVTCQTVSSQSIQISWSPPPPQSQNGFILGFKVFYKPIFIWEDGEELHVTTTISKVNLHNLFKYTNYTIQILAFTRVGDGIKTKPIICSTNEDVPGPPADIKALVVTSESILVTWLPPKNPNGQLVKYTLYIRNRGHTQQHIVKNPQSLEHSVHEIRSLREAETYEFWVTASTIIGEGESSRVINQSPKSKVLAQIASFSRRVLARWKGEVLLPCRAVGLPTPTRKWTFSGRTVEESDRIFIQKEGNLEIKDIRSTDAGNFTCDVENIYGSDQVTYSIVVRAPPPLPSLVVSGTSPTSLQLKIQNKGKPKADGFTLSYRREYGEWQEIEVHGGQGSGSSTSSSGLVGFASDVLTIDNLRCGTRYHLYVTTHNEVGASEPSEIVSVATKGEAPKVHNIEDAIRANVTTLTLVLRGWPDGGCPISYFVVKYRPVSAAEWVLVSNNVKPSQGEVSVGGLQPGIWYAIHVTAYNDAGMTMADYTIATLTENGATIAPLSNPTAEKNSASFYMDWHVMIPIAAAAFLILIAQIIGIWLFLRRRKHRNFLRNYDPHSICTKSTAAKIQQQGRSPPTSTVPVTMDTVEMLPSPRIRQRNHETSTIANQEQQQHHAKFLHGDNGQYASFRRPDFAKESHLQGSDNLQQPPDRISPGKNFQKNISDLGTWRTQFHRSTVIASDNSPSSCHIAPADMYRTMCQGQLDQQLVYTTGYSSAQSESGRSDIGPMYCTESTVELRECRPVPDLIYHATDSSSSAESSPDDERRVFLVTRGGLHREQYGGAHVRHDAFHDVRLSSTESKLMETCFTHVNHLTSPPLYSDGNEMSEAECDREEIVNFKTEKEQIYPYTSRTRILGRQSSISNPNSVISKQQRKLSDDYNGGCAIGVPEMFSLSGEI